MTARRRAPAAADDVRTLGLFSAIGLLTTLMLQVRETPQPQELLTMACTDLPLLAALAWALLAPASYRRCRGGVALVLRLLVCLRVLSVDTTRLLEASMPVSDSLALALLHFIFTLAAASWLLPLGQVQYRLSSPAGSVLLVQPLNWPVPSSCAQAGLAARRDLLKWSMHVCLNCNLLLCALATADGLGFGAASRLQRPGAAGQRGTHSGGQPPDLRHRLHASAPGPKDAGHHISRAPARGSAPGAAADPGGHRQAVPGPTVHQR